MISRSRKRLVGAENDLQKKHFFTDANRFLRLQIVSCNCKLLLTLI